MSKKAYICGDCVFGNEPDSRACFECIYNSNFRQKNRISYNTISDGLKAGLNGSIRAKIENVIFNDPATVVFWSDNTRTVVKTQNGEKFDPEKGLAMAIAKKALGNEGNYFNEIKKWVSIDIARFNANHTTNVGEFLVQTSNGEFYCTDEPLLPPNVDFEYSAKRIVIRTKKSKDKKDSK